MVCSKKKLDKVYVVECDHQSVYSCHERLEIANLICEGCCSTARVVEYRRKGVVKE
jgi:hypothetical protein